MVGSKGLPTPGTRLRPISSSRWTMSFCTILTPSSRAAKLSACSAAVTDRSRASNTSSMGSTILFRLRVSFSSDSRLRRSLVRSNPSPTSFL